MKGKESASKRRAKRTAVVGIHALAKARFPPLSVVRRAPARANAEPTITAKASEPARWRRRVFKRATRTAPNHGKPSIAGSHQDANVSSINYLCY